MKRSRRSLGWRLGGLTLLLILSTGACWHKGNGQDSVASSPKPKAAPASDAAPGPVASADALASEPAAMDETPPGHDAKPASSAAETAANAEPASASGASAAPSGEASEGNVWVIPARDALLRASCARCHNGNLPTSVPAALAIYNLVEDPWYGRLKPSNYDGILRRVTGSTSIPETDKSAIVNFVHCARDAACEPAATADPR